MKAPNPTPLIQAITSNQTMDIAKLLIRRGANVNWKNHYGLSVLMYADRADAAQVLIDGGADVNYRMPSGETPLIMAAHSGFSDVCLCLLDNGAELEARCASRSLSATRPFDTALRIACQFAGPKTVRVLVDCGADTSVLDDDCDLEKLLAQTPHLPFHWSVIHPQLLEIAIIFRQHSTIPPYVLLEIIDYLPHMWRCKRKQKIDLLIRVYKSIDFVVEKRVK